MIEDEDKIDADAYARLFQMLSAVNKEAEYLKLSTVVHLTNMALLQLSLDWEGSDTEESSSKLYAILRSKIKLALKDPKRSCDAQSSP